MRNKVYILVNKHGDFIIVNDYLDIVDLKYADYQADEVIYILDRANQAYTRDNILEALHQVLEGDIWFKHKEHLLLALRSTVGFSEADLKEFDLKIIAISEKALKHKYEAQGLEDFFLHYFNTGDHDAIIENEVILGDDGEPSFDDLRPRRNVDEKRKYVLTIKFNKSMQDFIKELRKKQEDLRMDGIASMFVQNIHNAGVENVYFQRESEAETLAIRDAGIHQPDLTSIRTDYNKARRAKTITDKTFGDMVETHILRVEPIKVEEDFATKYAPLFPGGIAKNKKGDK